MTRSCIFHSPHGNTKKNCVGAVLVMNAASRFSAGAAKAAGTAMGSIRVLNFDPLEVEPAVNVDTIRSMLWVFVSTTVTQLYPSQDEPSNLMPLPRKLSARRSMSPLSGMPIVKLFAVRQANLDLSTGWHIGKPIAPKLAE